MPKKKNPFKEGTRVAPFGQTLPKALKRLSELREERKKKDAENIMMHLWDNKNTRCPTINFGLVPVDSILHRCDPECGKRESFAGTPACNYIAPNEDEVKIVNATIQWLATNCGRSFLHEFEQALKEAHKQPCVQNDPDDKRTTGYGPAQILDVDNGVDFTFNGMGLKGNREKPSTPTDCEQKP